MVHTKNNCHAWDLIIAGPTGLQCSNCGVSINQSSVAKIQGQKGGEKSVKSRFKGKTKEEISEAMSKVSLTGIEKYKIDQISKGMLKSINSINPDERY